ncbi:MAG: hypothetical protein Q4P33_00830 [Flaviflexus sp.]|nr:hypothetical protein [Flaviflexus sp.]
MTPHNSRPAAIALAVETVGLIAWSGVVLASGLAGERVVTEHGSETWLGLYGLVIAALIGLLAWAINRGSKWASGPAITAQVLLIGGAVYSSDFLTWPMQVALGAFGLIALVLLLRLRAATHRASSDGRDDG